LYVQQEQYDQAEPLFQRSVAILEKAATPGRPDLGLALANWADLYARQRRFSEAEPLYQRSLPILEKTLGPNHPDLGYILANLADLYARQRRYAEAEPFYRRSLPILEKSLGANNATVAIVLSNLAGLIRNQGRDPEADPLLKGRVPPRQKTAAGLALPTDRFAGDPLPATGVAKPTIADVEHVKRMDEQVFQLTSQGHFAEALPLATELQAALEKMYGPDNLAVAVNLDTLAGIYKHLGRTAEAGPLIRRSQAIRDAASATDHSEVAPPQ
jgi:tetratricopeptide (TPR) repeat protein